MFEYLIYKGKNYDTARHEIVRPQIINAVFSKVYKKISGFHIEILTMKPENEYIYEDDHQCILVSGSVYTKLDSVASQRKQLMPNELGSLNKEGLKELRGHFHILKIDKRNSSIIIYNDLFGLKPLYYGYTNTYILIGNSLAVFKSFDPDIDDAGFAEKLIFGHNLLNNTIYRNINTLNEASFLRWDGCYITDYYFSWYEYFAYADGTRKFNMQKYIADFNNIVYSWADKKNKNLITLTGGHDGRAVVSSFLKQGLQVESFSFGRPGSENTIIPEKIAEKLGFFHNSVYLLDEYEENYVKNAELTAYLSEGELIFSQQTTLFAIQSITRSYNKVFTGLLAGELAGPVHLLTDYINPDYYRYIYLGDTFYLDNAIKPYCNYIVFTDYSRIEKIIRSNIEVKKSLLSTVKISNNSHLFSLCDMITWGFRKFYGLQMHLSRYYLENIPIFCDYDLMDQLINSNYNRIYKASYKNLIQRRNSRKLQLELINHNSEVLSMIPLDRGYTPKEALTIRYVIKKIYKYFRRKSRIKKGNYVPDFLGDSWTNRVLVSRLVMPVSLKNKIFSKEIQMKEDPFNDKLTENDIRLISVILFLNSHHK